jgi:hypothetical protein
MLVDICSELQGTAEHSLLVDKAELCIYSVHSNFQLNKSDYINRHTHTYVHEMENGRSESCVHIACCPLTHTVVITCDQGSHFSQDCPICTAYSGRFYLAGQLDLTLLIMEMPLL